MRFVLLVIVLFAVSTAGVQALRCARAIVVTPRLVFQH
jgi:hypothetical protein